METELLKTVGQIAGIGGIALGVFLLLFRDIIRKKIFPSLTKQQGFQLLMLISILVWTIALAGIGAWVWTTDSPGDRNHGTIEQKVDGGTGVIHTGDGDVSVGKPDNQ